MPRPYQEPTRHFKFTEDGITDEVAEQRRVSSYFVPIPQPRKRSKQLAFNERTQDRIEENTFINQIRERVTIWRAVCRKLWSFPAVELRESEFSENSACHP
jgi:type III restriction enzyme